LYAGLFPQAFLLPFLRLSNATNNMANDVTTHLSLLCSLLNYPNFFHPGLPHNPAIAQLISRSGLPSITEDQEFAPNWSQR
jgi:hypothetical protein